MINNSPSISSKSYPLSRTFTQLAFKLRDLSALELMEHSVQKKCHQVMHQVEQTITPNIIDASRHTLRKTTGNKIKSTKCLVTDLLSTKFITNQKLQNKEMDKVPSPPSKSIQESKSCIRITSTKKQSSQEPLKKKKRWKKKRHICFLSNLWNMSMRTKSVHLNNSWMIKFDLNKEDLKILKVPLLERKVKKLSFSNLQFQKHQLLLWKIRPLKS